MLGYANELGLDRATTKFVAEALAEGSSDRLAEAAWTTILPQAALGVAAGMALALAAPLLSGRVLRMPPGLAAEATAVFYLLASAVPLVVTAAGVRGVLEAAQRFDLVNMVRGLVTAANFLKYVDGKFFDGGGVNRSVRPDNTTRKDVEIQVIQFQSDPTRDSEAFPPIPLERTSVTGLTHNWKWRGAQWME